MENKSIYQELETFLWEKFNIKTMDLFDLKGKTALVTGCKRGIGMGMAIGLAEAGADIIGVSEVENLTVLNDLVAQPALQKLNYQIVFR